MENLSWMTGHWHGEVWGGLMTEYWSPLEGGTMMVYNRVIRDGKTVHREFISVEVGNPTTLTVHLFRRPDGTVVYNLVESGLNMAVFENMDHERLQRMVYQREGTSMQIALEGRRGGEVFRDEIVLIRSQNN